MAWLVLTRVHVLDQVLHEPKVAEPPAKKLKQAAAQPKRKVPAKENAKPPAGTKRKEVECEVGTLLYHY